MTPYYSHDGIIIYCGDNREVLPDIEQCDLLLTDPPYGLSWRRLGFTGKPRVHDGEAGAWDELPGADVLQLARDKCRASVIWGGNYLSDMLPPNRAPLIWDKKTGANSFADGEMAWSDICGTMRIFRHQWCGCFKDSERGIRNVHPTQKPVALMSWCIELAKKRGRVGVVLDPWAGSGSTLVAAQRAGIRAIGIEINEQYCEAAALRLRQSALF